MQNFDTQKIIFSIDGEGFAFKRAAFWEAMAAQGVTPYPLLGVYKGGSEFSWCLTYEDFLKVPLHFLEGQESVLAVTKCNKQYATLVYFDHAAPGTITSSSGCTPMGSMVQVSQLEATQNGDYTCDANKDLFFIAKHENPDRECKADREARELWAAIDEMIDAWERDSAGPLWHDMNTAGASLIDVRDKQKPKWLTNTQ